MLPLSMLTIRLLDLLSRMHIAFDLEDSIIANVKLLVRFCNEVCSDLMSPRQKRRGHNMWDTLLHAQCLLKISAGFSAPGVTQNRVAVSIFKFRVPIDTVCKSSVMISFSLAAAGFTLLVTRTNPQAACHTGFSPRWMQQHDNMTVASRDLQQGHVRLEHF